jgi:hypothetical protein
MARLNNGEADIVRSWGPGYNDGPDSYAAPTWYHNRGMKITNTTGKDLFLPDNAEAERNSVYRAGPGSRQTGNWVDNAGRLRRDQVATGIYCWSGPNFDFGADPQPTPPACPSGYSDGGIYATQGPMPIYGDGLGKTYRPPYDGTVPVTDWGATYGEQLDITWWSPGGASRNAVYMCQSLAQGYFWLCSASFPYQWTVVRACYRT